METAERVGTRERADARDKATGATRYSADKIPDGTLHVAVVRSVRPHARIAGITREAALAADGVVGVAVAADLQRGGRTALCGRRVRDMPLLATGKVRFIGEGVAAVLATSRTAAERAAALVDVDYEDLPATFDPIAALDPGAPRVHDAAWRYEGAVLSEADPPNLQSEVVGGSLPAVVSALEHATYALTRTYRTPSGHQGYLEPQCWSAAPRKDGGVSIFGTAKAPYRLREQVAGTLCLPLDAVEVEPMPLGGDFGGKGGVVDATLCAALAIWSGRPVRLALRSWEDLSATDARHASVVEVRVGCDTHGKLVALGVDAVLDGGAYAAAKPIASVNLHGIVDCALGYRLDDYFVRSRIAYTNAVPKGHMRAPGAPQAVFAVESALDELAATAGLDPADLRRRNLLGDGDRDAYGHRWEQARGGPTLEAALEAALGATAGEPAGPGLLHGSGIAIYARPTSPPSVTSLRLIPVAEGSFEVEVPFPETGTGSHSLVREELGARLGVDPQLVTVRQVSTSSLPYDPGVGGSRVTAGLTTAVQLLVDRWEESDRDGPVTVESAPADEPPALSYCAQVAHVAVDPETGQVRVTELVTAIDVATVVRPASHRLQIDGGAVMGLGFACLEDLLESDGQVWAGSLGEHRLPSAADVPVLRTVLVEGGRGVGPDNVKSVGELANVPTGAAVANAVANATGCRIRELPITAERVYRQLREHRGAQIGDHGQPDVSQEGGRA